MKKILVVFFVSLSLSGLFAQTKDTSKAVFTGRLSEDAKLALTSYENTIKQESLDPESKKSLLLAGAMSAIVPGAGEIYTKSYWKAAAFLAVEATAIIASVYYNKKGDEATQEFKDYANSHWSPVMYAEWLNKYAESLGAANAPKININYNSNLQPWQQVDFNQIRAVEEKVPTFSHRIENFGEQQYYEVIGKYKQFMHGWDQSDPNSPAYNFQLAQQIQFSDMFVRPDETFYKYSTQAVTVLMINHILSAIDAVWSANNYNKNITVGVKVNQSNFGGLIDYYPQLSIKYRF